DLPRRDPAADRMGAARDHPVPRRRDGGAVGDRGASGPRPRLPRPALPRLPDRVRAQPARPALRDRPDGPGEVGLDPEALPLLGLLVSLLRLPPGAPLLSGRAVLQPAPAPLRAAPVL